MRRTLIALAAAGLLAVGGCSDSDSGDPSSDEDAAAEDAAAEDTANEESDESGGDVPEGFCADYQSLADQFADDAEATADPEAVLAALETLDPPDEIAEDFATLIDANRNAAEIDPNDPEAMADFQEEVGGAQERFGTYLSEECNISPTG